MKKDCQHTQRLLDRKWDGDALDDREQGLVTRHLEQCAECRAFDASMADLLTAATDLRAMTYDRDLLLAPLVIQPRRPASPLRWAAGLAAAAAVLAVGVGIGHFLQPSPTLEVASQQVMVRFAVPAPNAGSVEIVGDFTDWRERVPLQVSRDGLWVGQVQLTPGRYQYVIVIDSEQMLPDPAARQVVDDGFGGKNSVIDVGI